MVGSTTAASNEAERHRSGEIGCALPPDGRRPSTLDERRRASPKAIALEIRNAIEPNRSGAQISRSCCCTDRLAMRAAPVLILKNSVPID